GLHDLQRQPCVIGAIFGVDSATFNKVLLQQRFITERLRAREHAPLIGFLYVRQPVVQLEPERSEEITQRFSFGQEQQHLFRHDEVRREVVHHRPFAAHFLDESELEPSEAAKAAMDECRGPATGAVREVSGRYESSRKASGYGIQRDTRARHAAANHQQVETLSPESFQQLISDAYRK